MPGFDTASRVYPTCGIYLICRTRASPSSAGIHLLAKRMDCRVKPGNDDSTPQARRAIKHSADRTSNALRHPEHPRCELRIDLDELRGDRSAQETQRLG